MSTIGHNGNYPHGLSLSPSLPRCYHVRRAQVTQREHRSVEDSSPRSRMASIDSGVMVSRFAALRSSVLYAHMHIFEDGNEVSISIFRIIHGSRTPTDHLRMLSRSQGLQVLTEVRTRSFLITLVSPLLLSSAWPEVTRRSCRSCLETRLDG